MDYTLIAKLLALSAGVVFGSIAISSASWVWFKRQVFSYGGSCLSIAGVVLISLSIYHSVKFGVTSTGVNFEALASATERAEQLINQAANRQMARLRAVRSEEAVMSTSDFSLPPDLNSTHGTVSVDQEGRYTVTLTVKQSLQDDLDRAKEALYNPIDKKEALKWLGIAKVILGNQTDPYAPKLREAVASAIASVEANDIRRAVNDVNQAVTLAGLLKDADLSIANFTYGSEKSPSQR